MYAEGKYFISVNAPEKSVLAGFPTQTHLKAGGAKLRLKACVNNDFVEACQQFQWLWIISWLLVSYLFVARLSGQCRPDWVSTIW